MKYIRCIQSYREAQIFLFSSLQNNNFFFTLVQIKTICWTNKQAQGRTDFGMNTAAGDKVDRRGGGLRNCSNLPI